MARHLGAGILVAGFALLAPATASARAFVPPDQRIFHGVSDTGKVADFHTFNRRVGAHSALLQDFFHWGTPLTQGFHRWHVTRTRGVLSLSTAPGGQPELISPRDIARGRGDDYILDLNRSIAASGQVVYIRLFPEMNGSWNPYCAFNADGSFRGPSHSTRSFRKAWQRIVMIVRGGSRKRINHGLRLHGMPFIDGARSNHDPVYRRNDVPRLMPHPKVAFMWVPQTVGSPAVAGNAPADYWPGAHFVDWVGADIYSKYATVGIRAAFRRFYRTYDRWPFLVGEYSPWDNDYEGRFTRWLFSWAERSRRARALIYYRSVFPDNEFDINHWPAARQVIRAHLNKHRFDAVPPGARRERP